MVMCFDLLPANQCLEKSEFIQSVSPLLAKDGTLHDHVLNWGLCFFFAILCVQICGLTV